MIRFCLVIFLLLVHHCRLSNTQKLIPPPTVRKVSSTPLLTMPLKNESLPAGMPNHFGVELENLQTEFLRFREETAQQLVYFRGDIGRFEQDLTSLWKSCSQHQQLIRSATDLLEKSQLLYNKIRRQVMEPPTTTTTPMPPTTTSTRTSTQEETSKPSTTKTNFVLMSKAELAAKQQQHDVIQTKARRSELSDFDFRVLLYAAFILALISIALCICIICYLFSVRRTKESFVFGPQHASGLATTQQVYAGAKPNEAFYCRNDNVMVVERNQKNTLLHIDSSRATSPPSTAQPRVAATNGNGIHPSKPSLNSEASASPPATNSTSQHSLAPNASPRSILRKPVPNNSNSKPTAAIQLDRRPVEDDYCYYYQAAKEQRNDAGADNGHSFKLSETVDHQSKEPLIGMSPTQNGQVPAEDHAVSHCDGQAVMFI